MAQKTKTRNIEIIYKLFFTILLCFIVFNIISDKYLSTNYWQRFPSLKNAYYDSVYANKKGGFIPDETLYSFNGGALVQGTSPILVNPEIPPVGKYLIGLSILFFNNEHIIILFSAVISLIMLFLIGRQIFSSSLIALLPPFFLSLEPIFKNQLVYTPLLDIIHLMFLLFSFYFFNLALRKKKNIPLFFLLTSIAFGLFISTKFFGLGITVVLAFYAVLLLNKDKLRFITFSITLPVSVFVLLLSYMRVLIIGYQLNKFLGIQKWVYWYNQGHLHFSFSVWPLLLFNKWFVSWDKKTLSDPQWLITWPMLTVFSLAVVLLYILKKIPKKIEAEILIAWIPFYLIFLSFGDANARYFVILIPIMYLVSVFGIKILIEKLLKHENLD